MMPVVGLLQAQVPVPPVPPIPDIPEIIVHTGADPRLIWVAMVAGVAVVGIVVLGPIGRAIGDVVRRLFGVHRATHPGELEDLRAEVGYLRERLAELEERQDFAERMLAQARERGLLAAPDRPRE